MAMSDTYVALAHFAQSWGLVYFFLVFVVVVLLVMRPSRKRSYEEAARLPLRED
jgi:cytochrome c oxidase cbb3-type subunit 4